MKVKNEVVKHQINSHAKLDLGSTTQVVSEQQQQALKILNQVQDDNMITTTHGFTLIELLVVVLIIGILAAVAVPQYQKAVSKSRMTEALTILPSLRRSANVYMLANGTQELTDILKFDIEIPGNRASTQWSYWNVNDPKHYYYSCVAGQCVARAWDNHFPDFLINATGNLFCISSSLGKSDKALNICKSLGVYDVTLSTRNGYSCYRVNL